MTPNQQGILLIVIMLILTAVAPYAIPAIVVIAGASWLVTNYSFLKPSKKHHSQTSEVNNFRYMKAQYLKSPAWNKKRKQVLARDHYTCTKCGKTNLTLNVHHLSYKNLPNEPLSDLTSLCTSCHTQVHKAKGYPQTYQDYMDFDTLKYHL